MAWDIEANGTIKMTPLVEFEPAVISDALCALRLTFALPTDPLGTGSLVIQTTMSVGQARLVRDELQRMIERIEGASENATAH